MIARIEGTVVYMTDKFIVVDVNGVGYKTFVTADTIASCTLGDTVAFWTYTAVRENSLDLYGFISMEEMSFFELLLDVSGIGPKSALSILIVASIDTLKKAIATGDTSYLNKVSGIGKKTAEKIVIELRDKLQAFKQEGSASELRGESDVVEALKALGYSQNEARDALKSVPADIEGTNARIKSALKILGGR
ncbi:MAG TPA: Holliday junction branch migration protein RuvA [Cyclobacteriaceae bacterium]|jgi:Holliday junction DNA helicase RuvA|nr:Holliday junction branch migration protein RuvA [Cyclobacteriaceae bacterium]